MYGKMLLKSLNSLSLAEELSESTAPLLLVHPAENLSRHEKSSVLSNFSLSKAFFSSPNRKKEWVSLQLLTKFNSHQSHI